MPAIELGAHGGIAQVGMHRIGEIDRRGATRQGDKAAFGCETKNLVLVHAEAGILHHLFRAVAALQQVHHVAQPAIGCAVLAIPVRYMLAIAPMGATPRSAISCISWVRIWISTRCFSG